MAQHAEHIVVRDAGHAVVIRGETRIFAAGYRHVLDALEVDMPDEDRRAVCAAAARDQVPLEEFAGRYGPRDLTPAIRAIAEAGHSVYIPERSGRVTL